MSLPVQYRRRGQAVWLDTISNRMIREGRLGSLITEGSAYGVTSNPSIFGQAIQKNEGDYAAALIRHAEGGADAFAIYDQLTRRDIAEAADLFLPMHTANPDDGWVSLEVLPSLAHDADATVTEARRLHDLLGRPNVFIKVPATKAGLVAIRNLIGRGVSVNVTLMFNRAHYRDVASAYISGVEDLLASGGDVSRVRSVASFFVSRTDTLVDKLLDERLGASSSPAERASLTALKGTAGVANCRVVYQDFVSIFGSPRFRELAAKGANVQRPLWASTGTKNPAYSDLLYVENLVGPDTVNTMPEKTLEALLHHGRDLGDSVLDGVEAARRTLADLADVGVDVEAVGEKLQVDGVVLFAKAYDELLATVESRRAEAVQNLSRTQKVTR